MIVSDCGYQMCIYNKDRVCILESVSISPTGDCEDCMLPNIPDEIVEIYKNDLLNLVGLSAEINED